MNRIKLKKRKKRNIMLVFGFIIGILLIVPAYAYMREQLKFDGKAKIIQSDLCSGEIDYEIYKWGGPDVYTYKLSLKLTNTGDKDYNFWKVYFDVPSDATVATYSASIAQIIGTKMEVSNESYNGFLIPGGSTNFEIQMTTSEESYEPTNFIIKNCTTSSSGSGESGGTGGDSGESGDDSINNLEIEYKVVASYGNYIYQYDVVVKNVGTEKIDAWNFSIIKPVNTKVVNAWGANYVTGTDVIEFSNASYTGTINAGSSITFGLIIETDIFGYIPSLANK